MSKGIGTGFGGLLLGAAVGAVLGILYAPRAGVDTRAMVSEKLDDYWGQGQELYARGVDKVAGTYETAQEKINDARATIVPRVDEKSDELRTKIDEARERIATQVSKNAEAAQQKIDEAIPAAVEKIDEISEAAQDKVEKAVNRFQQEVEETIAPVAPAQTAEAAAGSES